MKLPASASPQAARELFLSHIAVDLNLAAGTRQTYDRDLVEFLDWCNVSRIDPLEISTSQIEGYLVGQRYRRLSPATIAKKLSLLKHFYSFMDSEGIIESDPCAPIYAPKLMRRIPRPLTPRQMDMLLSQPNSKARLGLRDKAILELWYACGLRIAEMQDLKVDDFFAEQKMLRVIGKGNKQRYVPFGEPALRWVQKYLDSSRPFLSRLGSSSNLFLNSRGKRLSRMGLWKIVRKYGEKCGLSKHLTPHTIRHSCATHLLEAGADIRVVMEFLGHADISTTQIYTHLDDLHRRSEYLEFHPRAVNHNDRPDSVQE